MRSEAVASLRARLRYQNAGQRCLAGRLACLRSTTVSKRPEMRLQASHTPMRKDIPDALQPEGIAVTIQHNMNQSTMIKATVPVMSAKVSRWWSWWHAVVGKMEQGEACSLGRWPQGRTMSSGKRFSIVCLIVA